MSSGRPGGPNRKVLPTFGDDSGRFLGGRGQFGHSGNRKFHNFWNHFPCQCKHSQRDDTGADTTFHLHSLGQQPSIQRRFPDKKDTDWAPQLFRSDVIANEIFLSESVTHHPQVIAAKSLSAIQSSLQILTLMRRYLAMQLAVK